MTLDEAKKSRIYYEWPEELRRLSRTLPRVWNDEKRLPYPIQTYPLVNLIYEVIGFPPPWPDRPWLFSNMVSSVNGIVAWKRSPTEVIPVKQIIGDPDSIEGLADLWLMRYLRTFGDTSVGSQTTRDQRKQFQTPLEGWETTAGYAGEIYRALYESRSLRKLSFHPRNIVYSASGNLEADYAVFNTETLFVTVITTERGAQVMKERGIAEKKNVWGNYWWKKA